MSQDEVFYHRIVSHGSGANKQAKCAFCLPKVGLCLLTREESIESEITSSASRISFVPKISVLRHFGREN